MYQRLGLLYHVIGGKDGTFKRWSMSSPDYLSYAGDEEWEMKVGDEERHLVLSPLFFDYSHTAWLCRVPDDDGLPNAMEIHQSWTGSSQTVRQNELLPIPLGHHRYLLCGMERWLV